MFNFLGLRKDSRKPPSEKEVDGGFVIIANPTRSESNLQMGNIVHSGETVEEHNMKMQTMNIAQPGACVIVKPSKPSHVVPTQAAATQLPVAPPAPAPVAAEAPSTLPDLLEDVPFMLAPHVLAIQSGFSLIPDLLLSRDINYNLATFHYDFTLENSVLHDA